MALSNIRNEPRREITESPADRLRRALDMLGEELSIEPAAAAWAMTRHIDVVARYLEKVGYHDH